MSAGRAPAPVSERTAHAGGPGENRVGARSATARDRDRAERLDEAASLTPTWRGRLASARLWIMVGVIAILATGASLLLEGAFDTGNSVPLDPESAKPNGAKAVVEVMRQQGVDVALADSLADVEASLGDHAASTTIVLQQRDVPLTPEQIDRLAGLGAGTLVVLNPGPGMLDDLGTEIASGGIAPESPGDTSPVGDRCDDPLAENAPATSQLGGGLYTVPEGAGYAACFVANDRHAVAIDLTGDTRIVAIGATTNLMNEYIAADSNAAMGLGLLGDHEHLIWYQPGVADLDASSGVSPIESFVPAWLMPAMLLLVIAGIATMVWRGRRLGPLVAERLPVVVAASETMEGRARLYGRTGSRLRALDNLRIGTISRLARLLALPATTGAYEVAIAVAQTVRRPREEVVSILVEATPGTDQELVELSDHLLRLERDCGRALAIPTGAEAASPDDEAPAPPRPLIPNDPAQNGAAQNHPAQNDQTPHDPAQNDPAPPRGDA